MLLVRVELVYLYLDILGGVWKNLHRRFVVRYVPRLQKAVTDYFQFAPDIEIRKIQREYLDRTLKNLYNLLKRVYPIKERHGVIERLSLSLATTMLKSNYLQRRIDGLKSLNEIIKDASKSYSHTLTPKHLAVWIQQHDILEELIGPRTHPQILQRSSSMINFLYEQHLLDEKTLEKIWAIAGDESFQQDVFKILQEVAFPLDSPEFAFFAQKIAEMSPLAVCEKALDVVYEGRKMAEKFPELLLKYSNILAKIAFEDSYPVATSEKALNKYVGTVSYTHLTLPTICSV
eukprot:TRINITY_DN4291_c0_g3_i1.p1 TRINITY_DN4291_c0_g3~~TRINITY_DN4291_c0_g3_i1.p1  ORF type:complete len:289 (+),score=59.31 TRINITY_DN4291_c0_g3_i1:1085-1951(+)